MLSAKTFLGRGRRRPRPKIPVPWENSNYGKCAQEICLTRGVHLRVLRPFCAQIDPGGRPRNFPAATREHAGAASRRSSLSAGVVGEAGQ
jgi:hypothetical protein